MKKLIILTACALAFTACNRQSSSTSASSTDSTNTAQNISVDTTKLATGQVYYECPMHPEVISDKPGTCPKCQMDLEPHTKI